MIIKSLEIENFRQYVGKIKIDFSTSDDKKLTVIIGKGTAGKTTLINSFKWIFYGSNADGKSDYYDPYNEQLVNECAPNEKVYVKGTVVLIHEGITYTITRKEEKWKREVNFSKSEPHLYIDFIDQDGISQQKKDDSAIAFMNTIVPKNLVPYLFFRGEHMTRISEELLKANTSKEAEEFKNAVTCLLGFNFYQKAIDHLNKLSMEYSAEIAANNHDAKLANISKEILKQNEKKAEALKLLNGTEEEKGLYAEKEYLEEQIEIKSNQIAENAAAEEKQKRTITIQSLLENNNRIINTKRQKLFEYFSSSSVNFFAKNLLNEAYETLEAENHIDDGIPMMDNSSIDYILNKMKKCICGCDLLPGSSAYENVNAWKEKLPPVGIGTEIANHRQFLDSINSQAERFVSSFNDIRKELFEFETEQNKLSDELKKLNLEIENIPDVSKLKASERQYRGLLSDIQYKIKCNENTIKNCDAEIEKLENEQSSYVTSDKTIKKLLLFRKYTDACRKRIQKYCSSREPHMRSLLEDLINEIYKKILNTSNIKLSLSPDYALSIKNNGTPVSKTFMASESQRAIIVFSFITGVVELAGRTKETEDKNFVVDDSTEAYPLVFDAPTSTFDKDSTIAFSGILNEIAEQVIIFVNDKDGELLLENMGHFLGKKYEITKIDDFHSTVGGIE